MMEPADVAIIGAGPIGIELAVALKRRGIEYLHFDARQVGYTISWFAPQTQFFSSNERIAIAGVPLQTPNQNKATREEYLAYLRSVVQQFDLHIRTYEPIESMAQIEGLFELTTSCGGAQRQYRARRLVLATGGTARPRMLNVPGEGLPHVSHYFQDPHTYFRKRVLIIGGKNSAIEATLRCYRVGAHVTLSYRRDKLDPEAIKYWLLPEVSGLLQSGRIRGILDSTVQSIAPGHTTLLTRDGRTIDVPADFVLPLIGYEADMSLCRMAGVQLNGPGQVPTYDEQTMQTNVSGLYLAGTVVGGTQEKYRVFIENCHVHVDRIVASLTGEAPPEAPAPFVRPES